MKSIIIAALLGLIEAKKDDTMPVWGLRSVNDHRDDSQNTQTFGTQSTNRADARTAENPYRSHAQKGVPIGQLVAMNSEVAFDDNAEIQLSGDGFYNAWESKKLEEGGTYERQLPTHFTTGSDDIFMRSMLTTYAVEEKACEEDEDGKKTDKCKPTGAFFLNEAGARAAAKEVLATHKGLTGDALKTYLDTYFAKAWSHFDVNKTGTIEVSKAPQFMRFLASDQRMSLGESSF